MTELPWRRTRKRMRCTPPCLIESHLSTETSGCHLKVKVVLTVAVCLRSLATVARYELFICTVTVEKMPARSSNCACYMKLLYIKHSVVKKKHFGPQRVCVYYICFVFYVPSLSNPQHYDRWDVQFRHFYIKTAPDHWHLKSVLTALLKFPINFSLTHTETG